MVFLNPLFLWTLFGLSIPIAIHLWSKKKVKTIKIGSTQLLKEQNPKQTSSIRLNQWVLLLLRLIILTLISLLIAGTNFEINRKDKIVTYLVEPSLLNVDKVASILDTIEDDQKRLLENDFPYIEDADPVSVYENAPNYWQLTQQLEEIETDSVVIFTRGLLKGFRGMRPETRVPINWILFEEGIASSEPVEINKKEDQITIVNLQSDASRLTFYEENYTLNKDIFYVDNEEKRLATGSNKDFIPLPIRESKSKDVLLIFEEAYSAEKYYISSAFRALSAYLNIEIKINSVKDIEGVDLASFDALIWLKNEPVVPFEGSVLVFQLDEFASNLIDAGNSADEYVLNNYLTAENSVSQNLPAQLLVMLRSHEKLRNKIQNLDRRVMDLDEIETNRNYDNDLNNSTSRRDISTWLWAFLLLVLPLERVLSKIKRQ